ncbi:CLUMA_CG003365, isoform A [Clunio marinus]|uniref:CLUMA_CG003365, isoform A n=1 Tax=Clunio marinus TaxID=568069 RepID=A0A1J1HQ34_9DIPT|nr:CLUMA_CG003365, isoform A [Clunio marinus]
MQFNTTMVLINNRDEYYSRSTQNATLNFKSDRKSVYGIDLAGAVRGTWLGISAIDETIKIGNLANVTGEENQGKLGRGPIVTNFIESDDTIELYNKNLLEKAHDFSSFNFLSVEITSDSIKSSYLSNIPKAYHILPLGYTGIGNSPLVKPFVKVVAGSDIFKNVVDNHKDSKKEDFIKALMDILKCDRKYFPDEELISRRKETAEPFSSIHVVVPSVGYGTRTRTVILVDNNDNIDYIEETMKTEDPNGEWETTQITFSGMTTRL